MTQSTIDPNATQDSQEDQEQANGGQGEQTPTQPQNAPQKGAQDDDPYAQFRKDLTADEAEKLIEKLKAANGEAAANRHRLKDLERQAETDTDKKIREAQEQAAQEATSKYAGIIKRTAATAAFTTAGATQGHDSLYRLVDQDKITVADDGTVEGLSEEIERIKGEFPALFVTEDQTNTKRRTASKVKPDGGDKKPNVKKSSAQKHADRILGR